ncbi:uncharacterized protein LOC126676748 [Mercurialis annua]|uniref:uncharacterized protein LOC126676748 n=1 Tax=Mercurialis annua TaxID=3986 RepID=UPI002160E0F5|nr:uncharacterized protein LOC126676748 [Mercurialis annua]
MASSSIPLLLLSLIILLSTTTTTSAGRLCKTLYVSSYTFSIRPLNPNPNSNNNPSSGFVTIVTEITQQQQHQRSRSDFLLDPRILRLVNDRNSRSQPLIPKRQEKEEQIGPVLPFGLGLGLSSYDINSLRDRTKDILSVVVALLFGVGCGALTAATMYLVWSLFATRYDYHYDGEFDGEDEDVDDVKKMGYVKIPDADKKQVKEVV